MTINLQTATAEELKGEYKKLISIIENLKFDRLDSVLNEKAFQDYTARINRFEDEAISVMAAYKEREREAKPVVTHVNLLDRLENESVWELTELNTRKKTFKNDVEDILYGDNYRTHTFATKEEAQEKAVELKAQGISTNLARVLHM